MNFKDNIERCKKAQELGLRVQYLTFSQTWLDSTGPRTFSYCEAPDRYRVHPDDEKLFASVLLIEELHKKLTNLEMQKTRHLHTIIGLQNDNEFLKAGNARMSELIERLQKQPSTDDLLLQLLSRLGTNASITFAKGTLS